MEKNDILYNEMVIARMRKMRELPVLLYLQGSPTFETATQTQRVEEELRDALLQNSRFVP